MSTLHTPELHSATERCVTTSTGIAIGRCYAAALALAAMWIVGWLQ